MRFQGTCYRGHNPKWASNPLSGEGASLKGGRFNPVGISTLYLALTIEGVFLEMGGGFSHRFEPLTICSYAVDVENIVDLRDEAVRADNNVKLADMACDWEYGRAIGKIPASWILASNFIKNGVSGILVPSFAIGAAQHMSNLVLWKWGAALPHKVEIYDPNERLSYKSPIKLI
jgi:RES domain-containing protein